MINQSSGYKCVQVLEVCLFKDTLNEKEIVKGDHIQKYNQEGGREQS